MRHFLAMAVILVLGSLPGWSQDLRARGDLLARVGAYQAADEAYRQAEAQAAAAERQDLIVRRLAVAEMAGDEVTAGKLLANLQEPLSPALAMRVFLIRGNLAYRRGLFKEARGHFGRAEDLAATLDTPGARMARYAAASFRYEQQILARGRPTPQEYQAAFGKAFEPVTTLPLTEPLEPLEMLGTAHWGRFWIRTPVMYGSDLFSTDRAASDEWHGIAAAMATGGISSLQARARAALDWEASYLAEAFALEMTEAIQIYTWSAEYAEPWLAQARQLAQAVEAYVAAYAPQMGLSRFFQQDRLGAQLKRASAAQLALRKQLPQAASEYRQSLQEFTRLGLALDAVDTRLGLGATLGWIEPRAGGQELSATLSESRKLGYPWGIYFALFHEGQLKARQNDLTGAEASLRDGLAQLDEMLVSLGATPEGRLQILDRADPLFSTLIDVLMRQGKVAEAAELSDRQNATRVVASLDLSRVRPARPELAAPVQKVEALREERREISGQLAAAHASGSSSEAARLEGQLASNREEFYRNLNQIRQLDPEFERVVTVRPTTFSKLQGKLPADTVLLQYYPAGDRLLIFVATREKLRIQAVPVGRAELDGLVRTARDAMVRPRDSGLPPEGRAALTRLHQILIDPVEKDLEGRETVAVIPGLSLYYIPFSALARAHGDKLEHLIQRKNVVVLTALEVLTVFEQPPTGARQLLALGNPDGTLPFAEKEVTELAALFPASKVFVGAEATGDRVAQLPAGTSVLHLATHGKAEASDVNSSYLVVAGSQGKLTAGEIYGFQWREPVALVTLSACQTALGSRPSGAEIATLAQAFSVAGSRTIVASLWSVSDEATGKLMLEFYKNLLAGKARAEAMRQAQKSLLEDPRFSHPFYWAPFQVIGDWR